MAFTTPNVLPMPPDGAAPKSGDPFPCSEFIKKTLQLHGYTAGTFQVHGAVKDTFAQLGADLTANGWRDIPEAITQLKIVRTVGDVNNAGAVFELGGQMDRG